MRSFVRCGVIGSVVVALAVGCGEAEQRIEERGMMLEAEVRPSPPPATESTRQAGSVVASPDGSSLATLLSPPDDEPSGPWRVALWNLETGAQIKAIPIASGRPGPIAFRTDGRRLAVATRADGDHGVAVVDVEEGRVVGSFSTGAERVLSAVFSADSQHLLVSEARSVELRDAETLASVARAEATSPIPDLPLCQPGAIPDDLPIADPPPPAPDCATAYHEPEAFLSPAGSLFVQTSRSRAHHGPIQMLERQVTLYGAGTLEVRCRQVLSDSDFAQLAPGSFSSDDEVMRFVPDRWEGADGEFRKLDTESCTELPAEQEPVVMSARFVLASPVGGFSLAVGDARTAEVWATVKGRRSEMALLHVLAGEHARILGAAFSPSGERVALFDADNRIQVFETATARRLALAKVALVGEDIERVAFLPDDRRVLVAAIPRPSSIGVLVDSDTGQILRRFE
jgi:WD40 repeat protein